MDKDATQTALKKVAKVMKKISAQLKAGKLTITQAYLRAYGSLYQIPDPNEEYSDHTMANMITANLAPNPEGKIMQIHPGSKSTLATKKDLLSDFSRVTIDSTNTILSYLLNCDNNDEY